MPLTGHLKELRNRVIVCVVVLLVGMAACLFCAPRLVTLLTDLGRRYDYTYVYIAPQELLMVYFSISLLGGAVITFPVLAYEGYAFCSPGLRKREKMFFLLSLLSGGICFCVGVLFAFHVTVPFMLYFLIQFGTEVRISAAISVQEYVSFLLTVFMIFGVIFELPVLSVILTGLGIVKPEWLVKSRKVMIVVIFFAAAVITPPDIFSQIMVAVPMIGLYELSVLLSRVCDKFRKSRKKEE